MSDEVEKAVASAQEVEPDDVKPPPVPKSGGEPQPLKTTSNLPARSWPPKVLSDLMTRKVITVQENHPVANLETLMTRFHFHHLPVVTSEMKLVGLITRTDFLHAALGVGPDGKPTEKATNETVASAMMQRNVVTGTPDTSLAMACSVIAKEQLGCLPVILEDKTLVGIVTRTDIVRMTAEFLSKKG